jgi:hypothetical protein
MDPSQSDMPKPDVRSEGLAVKLIRIALGAALVGGLFFAGLRIYRHLPDGPGAQTVTNDPNANSDLTILLRSETVASPGDTRVELFPIDFSAAQRDFLANPRPGKTFDDFLALRTKGLSPVRAQLDEKGRAVAKLAEGKWWIRATTALPTGEILEWRLPITITGRGETIELTAENAYERTKKF